MTIDVQTSEEPSDLKRLRSEGAAELAVQFSVARERLRQMVCIRLDRKLGGRVDPSDIVQDAFIEASRRLPEYLEQPRLSPFMWLRQITRQTLANQYRKHAGTAKRAVDREALIYDVLADADSMVAEIEESIQSPHSMIAKAEIAGKLLKIVETMAPADREVLALKQLEQLSFTEVAEELEISVEAAMKRFQRAILRLGKLAAHLNRLS